MTGQPIAADWYDIATRAKAARVADEVPSPETAEPRRLHWLSQLDTASVLSGRFVGVSSLTLPAGGVSCDAGGSFHGGTP
jgi:hypothetical protein